MFSDIMENKDNSFNLICTYFDAVALLLILSPASSNRSKWVIPFTLSMHFSINLHLY